MATELADAASEAVVSVEHADSAEQTRGRGLVASVFYISAHANQPTHATTSRVVRASARVGRSLSFGRFSSFFCRNKTNSVIGVSRPPVLDCATTFHADNGGRDLPSTPSGSL